jgi:hypothetical protein
MELNREMEITEQKLIDCIYSHGLGTSMNEFRQMFGGLVKTQKFTECLDTLVQKGLAISCSGCFTLTGKGVEQAEKKYMVDGKLDLQQMSADALVSKENN